MAVHVDPVYGRWYRSGLYFQPFGNTLSIHQAHCLDAGFIAMIYRQSSRPKKNIWWSLQSEDETGTDFKKNGSA
jgi:hypothetical protein